MSNLNVDLVLQRRFRRSHISSHDFARAVEFLAAAQRYAIDSIEHEALLEAAIIHYARPFSGNERGNAPDSASRIDPAIVDFGNGPFKDLHDQIVKIRNEAVAHSSYARNPLQIVSAVVDPPNYSVAGITVSRPWQVSQENLDLATFEQLIRSSYLACQNALADDLSRNGSEVRRP